MQCGHDLNIIAIVVVMNIVLTTLHFILFKIHETKKWVWSDTALSVVVFLMSMLSVVMANVPHPDDKKES